MDRSPYPYILPLTGFAVYIMIFVVESSNSLGDYVFFIVAFGPYFFSLFLMAALIVVPMLMIAFVVRRKYIVAVIALQLILYAASYYWALKDQFLGSERRAIFAIFALVIIGNSYVALMSNVGSRNREKTKNL